MEMFLAQPKYFRFQLVWQTTKDLQQVPDLSSGLGWDQEVTFLPYAPFHLEKRCCSYQNDEGKKILMGKMPRACELQRITLTFEVVREWQKKKDLHIEGT